MFEGEGDNKVWRNTPEEKTQSQLQDEQRQKQIADVIKAEVRSQQVLKELVMDDTAQEARMLPEKGELSQSQREQVRQYAHAYITGKKIPVSGVARQINYSASVISEFLAGSYAGDVDSVARRLHRFIKQHESGEDTSLPPGFISTTVAKKMIALMKSVKRSRTMGWIIGSAGHSKTTVGKAAEERLIAGAVHIECTVGTRSAAALARMLCRKLHVKRTGRTLDQMIEALKDRLADTNFLLIIDEAHYLSHNALNLLRDLHKQADISIVLVGTVEVANNVDDFKEFRGQFESLFSFRYNVNEDQEAETGDPLYTSDEVVQFVTSMGLKLSGGAIDLAQNLITIPAWGAWRSLRMLLINAEVLAGKGARINEQHMKQALVEMRGRAHTQRVSNRLPSRTRKVKVA